MIRGNAYTDGQTPTMDVQTSAEQHQVTITLAAGEAMFCGKVSALLDGLGPTAGQQVFLAEILDATDTVLGGSRASVENAAEAAWIDWRFDRPALLDAPDPTYRLRLTAEGPSEAARWGHIDGDYLLYATLTKPWEPPYAEDTYLAGLGYASAQRALSGLPGATQRAAWSVGQAKVKGDPRTRRRVLASWHGTFIDEQPLGGSFAVVQAGGVLSDYVGERVVVQGSMNRSTVVYIHRETDLDLDDDTQISLSRRAWQALAPLGDDALSVTVSVVDDGVE